MVPDVQPRQAPAPGPAFSINSSRLGNPARPLGRSPAPSFADQVDAESVRPGALFASDPEARDVTERLIRDAGFDPIYLGDPGQARLLESPVSVTMGLARGRLGPYHFRFSRPGGLSVR